MNHENKKEYIIDSWPKLARYLGAVALEMPGAIVKILGDIETFPRRIR